MPSAVNELLRPVACVVNMIESVRHEVGDGADYRGRGPPRGRLAEHGLLCAVRQAEHLHGKRASASRPPSRSWDSPRTPGRGPSPRRRRWSSGLFVQFFEDEFSPAMLQYVLPISDAAREAGYDILMVTEADGPHAVQRIVSSGMVDGVDPAERRLRGHRGCRCMRKMRQPGAMVGLPRDPGRASTSSTSTSPSPAGSSSTTSPSAATARSS